MVDRLRFKKRRCFPFETFGNEPVLVPKTTLGCLGILIIPGCLSGDRIVPYIQTTTQETMLAEKLWIRFTDRIFQSSHEKIH